MRTVVTFALAVCVCAPQSAVAQPPHIADTIAPFRPFLSTNTAPQVCEPFLKAWTAVFDAPVSLSREPADLAAAFPGMKVTRTEEFYQTSNRFPVDIDGDGRNEVLYFNPTDYNWRYSGPDLYLADSEADLDAVVKAYGPDKPFGLNFPHGAKLPATFRKIRDMGPAYFVDVLQADDGAYVTSGTSGSYQTEITHASLLRIEKEGPPSVACEVEVLPPGASFAAFRDASPLFAGLANVYGEPSYQGSMGWTAPAKDQAFYTFLFRPWAMPATTYNPVAEDVAQRRRDDVARELRYLGWGVRDPQSWRDYLKVKDGRARFVADLQRYYATRFGKSDMEAQDLAETAWRYLLDMIFYARNSGPFALTDLVVSPGGSNLALKPDMTPAEIVRAATAASPSLAGDIKRDNLRGEETISALVLAAIYTRQPAPVVRELAERLRNKAVTPSTPYEEERARELKNAMLLAALGHDGLSELALDLGADPNAKTGEIQKTPLMYAAQHDRLNAVHWLLAHKVDVNAATDSSAQYGYQLQRDHRTPLMYAAENGSAPVIAAILKAGADVSAKDTQGNSAVWYFSRNTKIVDPADRARILSALGG